MNFKVNFVNTRHRLKLIFFIILLVSIISTDLGLGNTIFDKGSERVPLPRPRGSDRVYLWLGPSINGDSLSQTLGSSFHWVC